MAIAIIIYILVLICFIAISGLIVRHSIKFGYLSARFKSVVAVFGIIALIIIIFSIYLMFQGQSSSGSPDYKSNTNTSSGGTSSGDLQF
ncbi:hypothetical protein JW758_00535 [Candidatus Peregrinibacteria bacterium]|nr:hypothetical protein [Candidatus Peregrinibacteria bacterium]